MLTEKHKSQIAELVRQILNSDVPVRMALLDALQCGLLLSPGVQSEQSEQSDSYQAYQIIDREIDAWMGLDKKDEA